MLKRKGKEGPSIAAISAKYDRVALVFQGGGALGAYQAGVYQALADAGCEPNWISGVSIGAINAAIVAGNHPSDRLPRLRQFWETVSGRNAWPSQAYSDFERDMRNRMSATMTVLMGQPGFFKPRFPNPWLLPPGADGATSFYDSSELRGTLEALVDFNILNDGAKRFSVGSVNVRTGNFVYFDSDEIEIGPEHIMASGALPPGLPAVRIAGEDYWDGGIVSNTPLQHLLEQEEDRSSLVFQVDLFSSRGELPRSMRDVIARQKEIAYSSRTRHNTDTFRRVHKLKMKLAEALERVPEAERTDEDRALLADFAEAGVVNIIHLIYQRKNYESQAADYEFSARSMQEHWDSGLEDTLKTLAHTAWLEPPPRDVGVTVHDMHREDPD